MATVTLYGIPNCDTTKKAMAFLNKRGVDFIFHDYKQQGVSRSKLEAWCMQVGWQTLFNKRSTTWRELSEADREKAVNQTAVVKLMLEHSSIIKRPVIEFGNELMVGFNEAEISNQLKLKK